MEQNQEERNIWAPEMDMGFGTFPEDITLGRSESHQRSGQAGQEWGQARTLYSRQQQLEVTEY